jgi:molybdenum cofactor cytidylyltransferase
MRQKNQLKVQLCREFTCNSILEGLGEKTMQLNEALGLGNHEMVALIGAGGKTTTLLHLAKELRDAGKKVLVTTTTKIFKPSKPHVDKLFIVEDLRGLLRETAKLDPPLVIGAGSKIEEGKLIGLPAQWLDEIETNKHFDAVLVEADGAASRLFKVPSETEPVVPETTGLTIWIFSIKIVGKPLDATLVHRPERAAALSGTALGAPVTEELILQLARHPEGSLKGIPSASRKAAMINQADDPEEIQRAEHLGKSLLALGFDRVVVNSFVNNNPLNQLIPH